MPAAPSANTLACQKYLALLKSFRMAVKSRDETSLDRLGQTLATNISKDVSNKTLSHIDSIFKTLHADFLPLISAGYLGPEVSITKVGSLLFHILDKLEQIISSILTSPDKSTETSDIQDELLPHFHDLEKLKETFIRIKSSSYKIFTLIEQQSQTLRTFMSENKEIQKYTEDLLKNLEKALYRDSDSILATIYKRGDNLALNMDQHAAMFADESFMKKYKLIANTAIRIGLSRKNLDFEFLDPDIRLFINEGMISLPLWDKFAQLQREATGAKVHIDKFKAHFFRNDEVLPPPSITTTKVKIPHLDILQWVKFETEKMLSIPYLKCCLSAMSGFRDMIMRLYKEANKNQSALLLICNNYDKGDLFKKVIIDIEDNLLHNREIKNFDRIKKIITELLGEKSVTFIKSLETMIQAFGLVGALERECIAMIKELNERMPAIKTLESQLLKFDGTLNDMTSVFNNLLLRCSKGAKFNSDKNQNYAPMYFAGSPEYSTQHIIDCLVATERNFPQFSIHGAWGNYMYGNDTAADFNPSETSPNAVAGMIKSIRQRLRENLDIRGLKCVIFFPGIGNGSFSETSNAFLVPKHYGAAEFQPANFYTALCDYIIQKRLAESQIKPLEALAKAMKDRSDLNKMVSPGNTLFLLAVGLHKMNCIRENSDYYNLIKNEITFYLTELPPSLDEKALNNYFENFFKNPAR